MTDRALLSNDFDFPAVVSFLTPGWESDVNESALGPQEKHLSLSIQRSETASSVGDIGSPSLLSYLSPSIQHMFNGVNSTPWFLHGSTPPEPLKSFNTSMILLELLRSGRRGTPLLVFLLIKRQPVRCSLNWIFQIIRKIVLSYLVPLLLAGSFPEYSILNGWDFFPYTLQRRISSLSTLHLHQWKEGLLLDLEGSPGAALEGGKVQDEFSHFRYISSKEGGGRSMPKMKRAAVDSKSWGPWTVVLGQSGSETKSPNEGTHES